METTQEAIDKLAALADHETRVKYLVDNNYHGVRYAACECPVANYLMDKTGVEHAVSNVIVPLNPDAHPVITVEGEDWFAIPDPIRQVIHEFDAALLPELVRKSAAE